MNVSMRSVQLHVQIILVQTAVTVIQTMITTPSLQEVQGGVATINAVAEVHDDNKGFGHSSFHVFCAKN